MARSDDPSTLLRACFSRPGQATKVATLDSPPGQATNSRLIFEEGQIGAIRPHVKAVEDISPQEGIFFWNGHDFEVTESGCGHFQGDNVRIYHCLDAVVAFGQDFSAGQKAKPVHQAGREAGNIGGCVEFGPEWF